MFRSFRDKQEGDPQNIAGLLVKLAKTDDVPMRLILGVDAEKRVQQAEAARAAEAEKFRSLIHSTVYDGSIAVPEVLPKLVERFSI